MNYFRKFFNKFKTLKGLECPICLTDIAFIDQRIIVTRCGHFSCFECAKKINQNFCPICRQFYTFTTLIHNFFCAICFKLNNIIRFSCPKCGEIICESCFNNQTQINYYKNNFIICRTCDEHRVFRRLY